VDTEVLKDNQAFPAEMETRVMLVNLDHLDQLEIWANLEYPEKKVATLNIQSDASDLKDKGDHKE
jgi:hypothetical protein